MEPIWKLVMVTGEEGPCEECGTLGDLYSHAYFAYTVGLHEFFGRPEVHCPGLSADEEPASLTLQTLGEIVNTIAAQVAAREIGPARSSMRPSPMATDAACSDLRLGSRPGRWQ